MAKRVLFMRGILLLAVLAFCATAHADDPFVLHVSTEGNDLWSGRLAQANSERSDGPKASIAGARDAIPRLRMTGDATGAIQVLIRGGVYRISQPIVFGPDDSGFEGGRVTYQAYPGEVPVIDGGRRITRWERQGALWVADLPEVRDGQWTFCALWVNGERRTPARTPNAAHPAGDEPTDAEFFYADGSVVVEDAEGKKQSSNTRFHFRGDDVQPWQSLDQAWFVHFHSWATSLLRPKSLDAGARIVDFTGPARWPFCRWRGDQWYYVEHLFEALDQPGEWFLNRKTGKLYYMPMPGDAPESAEVVAPVASQLLRLEGDPSNGAFVEHLDFQGITFSHAAYPIAPGGHSDAQAAAKVHAAVSLTGARSCTFADCTVAHVNTYGLWLHRGCRDNLVARCEMVDLGAGGVRIGEMSTAASKDEAVVRNTIDNCFLHDGGRLFRSAVGVWIGRASYNRVSHNEICDFRYTGVSVGWSWGYADSSAHHNLIVNNHIHHLGHGQLSDMGGIYTLGVSPGTVLKNNHIHHIHSNPKVSGGWGLYTDEGSSEILLEGNLVHSTRTGGFHQHYGRENRVLNNIFAYSEREQLIRSREEEHVSFFFERNIVLFNNGRLLGSRWANGNYRLDRNCYWDTSGLGFGFAGMDFADWQAAGNDVNSLVADPGFADAQGGDFSLKPGSPALALGFEPIDLSDVGLYGDPAWVEKPKGIARPPFAPPKVPEPLKISEDFEGVELGLPAPEASTNGEQGDAAIRVSAEAAVSGTRSLKFVDAAGLAHRYHPHLVYSPHYGRGTATASFSLRAEAGAVLYHEWRDNRSPYRVGPGFRISADGALRAGGQSIAQLPHGQWVQFEIACVLGSEATGTWRLEITLPGAEPKVFEALPCGSSAFRGLDWFGFVADGDGPGISYLDDLDVSCDEQGAP